MTLIPVSRISWVGVRSEAFGAGRWIGQRSSAWSSVAVVDRLAEQVEDAAQGDVADRNRDRAAGVDDLVAALDPVGRVHRDRADAVVAEVLLDLADQLGRFAVAVARRLDRDRRVDLRQLSGKTASMTTPVTCSTRPTLVPLLSAMGSFSSSSLWV